MDDVNIIGGGIGGLALANALQHNGIGFQLYEQATSITEIGAAISLSKAALSILEKLGLQSNIISAGHETQNFHVADKNLNTIRFTKTASPVTIIHRAKLVNILSSPLPQANIHLSSKLNSIKILNDHAELDFANGTQVRSKCTAIADGINSISRKQIFPNIQVRYAHQSIWRGITPIKVPEKFLHSYFEIWSNAKRFLFVPMDSNNIFWLAITNNPPGGKDDPGRVRQELLRNFNDFHPFVKELMHNSSNFIRSDLADLGTQDRKWYKDHVVFLGDSIHATTPNLAQGGCQAIEDAYCLSCLMKGSRFDFSDIFPTYQYLREKKVSFIVKTSWNLGQFAHNPVMSRLALLYFRIMPESITKKLERKLNDISYIPDSI
jgi:2-polyprenyl-6-methoxyphenol hydroxylase-like FAD-dependent oxidoreductase